jgi:hypothetical protein
MICKALTSVLVLSRLSALNFCSQSAVYNKDSSGKKLVEICEDLVDFLLG